MTEAKNNAEKARYIAACIDAHAQKFPVPEHMRKHAMFLRDLADTIIEAGKHKEQDNGIG